MKDETPKPEPGKQPYNPVPDKFAVAPNWEKKCVACGAVPTVGKLGLCGPCCFGEADTAGGNW